MEGVMYSWLGAAAFAPFVTILSAWTLVVFCTYRTRWRLVDLFLFSMTAHEIVYSLFAFGFSVLSIIRPLLGAPCGFIVWGLVGTRTFHLACVTSLLLDRMLALKWPCKYRGSVRSSQVRYHVVVLGIIATFVGVTAVFARNPSLVEQGVCSIHPLTWDVKFSIFLASVYSMLLLVGLSCFSILMFSKRNPEKQPLKSPITEKPSLPPTLDSSGRCTSSSSNSSSKFYKNEWEKQVDIKWQTVASICWVSYVANHGPFLVMTIVGIATPEFWTSWQDNITVWLSLSQGILIPFILLVSDVPYRSAVKNMLRQPGRIYRHLSDHSGFQMQFGDFKCQKPGFSSSVMMYPPSSCMSIHNAFQVPNRIRWTPQTLPSLQSLTLGRHSISPFHALSERDSICKKSSSQCTSPMPPLYKNTLYSTFDSSSHSLLGRSCSSGISNCDIDHGKHDFADEEDTISITTDALDDFEFHGVGQSSPTTRPHIKTIFNSNSKNKRCVNSKQNSENSIEKSDDNSSMSVADSLNSINGQKQPGSHDRISCIFRPPSRSSRQDVFILNKNVFSPSKSVSVNSLDSLEVAEYEKYNNEDTSKLDINPCYANLYRTTDDKLLRPEEETFTSSPIDQNIIFSEYL